MGQVIPKSGALLSIVILRESKQRLALQVTLTHHCPYTAILRNAIQPPNASHLPACSQQQ